MQSHRACFGIILLACLALLGLATAVEGKPGDLYWTGEYGSSIPPTNPQEVDENDPSAGWTWPSEWHGPNELMPVGGLEIRPGFSRYFGLENEYVSEETKTFWISFSYTGGGIGDLITVGTRNGIHSDWNRTPGIIQQVTDFPTDNGSWFTDKYTVTPQPDWEWVCISNVNINHKTIVINSASFEMASICTPEPATLTLLAAGAVVILRKRGVSKRR